MRYHHYFLTGLLFLIISIYPKALSAFSCAHAQLLECGENYWFDAPLNDNFDRTSYDLDGCLNTIQPYDGFDHLYYIDAGAYPRDITIRMISPGANMDIFVFRSCTDHYHAISLEECIDNSLNLVNQEDTVTIESATGIYYIAIDAPSSGPSSDYLLYVECTPSDSPFLCESIPEIKCGEKLVGFNTHYNAIATDYLDYHPDCYGYMNKHDGYESIYQLKAHYGDLHDISIDLKSLGYGIDHDLFIYDHCYSYKDPWTGKTHYEFSGLLDYCHHSYQSYSSVESAFIEYLPYYDEIYIVVEGKPSHYHTNEGPFELVVSCGDPCDQKETFIECNSYITGTTHYSKNLSSYYECDPYSDRGNNWGPEKTYIFEVEEKTDIVIELEPDYHADLNLYLLDKCDQSTCLATGKTRGKGKNEIINKTLWPGTYYIVVEGYQGDHGDFKLHLSGCGCDVSGELHCDQPVWGTTKGSGNLVKEIKGECFALSSYPIDLKGNDAVYSFRAMESRAYTFYLEDLEDNVNLYLIEDCSDVNSCRGYSTKSGVLDEEITLEMTAYEEIFVLIDSRSTYISSDFTLRVVCEDEEEPDEEEPDEEEPDEEEPVDMTCFTSFITTTQDVVIDLTTVSDSSCAQSSTLVLVYKIDPETGEIDSSSVLELSIDSGEIVFYPPPSEMTMKYVVVVESSCDSLSMSCRDSVEIQPILTCGMRLEGTTVNQLSTFAKEDIEACYQSPSLFDGPDELIQIIKSSDSEILEMTMFQEDANLSLFVFDEHLEAVRNPCKAGNFNEDKTLGNAGAVGEYISDREDPLDAGVYFLLIEGYAKKIQSDFMVSLSCGLDCADPLPIVCGQQLTGQETKEYSSQASYVVEGQTKVGYTGGEQVYEFSLDKPTYVNINLDNIASVNDEEADLDIFLMSGSCEELNVLYASTQPGDTDESIEADLMAGQYIIVVDGWKNSKATFDLNVLGCDSSAITGDQLSKSRSFIDKKEAFKVYPNPFNNHVVFDLSGMIQGEIHLQIFHSDGQKVFSKILDQDAGVRNYVISGDELGTGRGVFLYRIETLTGLYQGKIIRLD